MRMMWLYALHRIMEIARALVQTVCSALKVFFDMVGLKIFVVKFEAKVFNRKHRKPDVTLFIDRRSLPQHVPKCRRKRTRNNYK
jgi:hypothetical protein